MNIQEQEWDYIIIGAGMSGLAAGVRLAHFGQKVLILEKHNAPGGLNSFYSINGRRYDVGLHAVTNYAPKASKQAPLNKLLRQLRLSREELDLSEQNTSRILFKIDKDTVDLQFSNTFELFKSQIAEKFPHAIDGFLSFVEAMKQAPMGQLSKQFVSTRKVISEYVQDPLLIEMLLLPLFYYGSAHENDMDFDQAIVMFQSIFEEGFARPFEGVRQIIRVLLQKYRQLGGLRKMQCAIKKLIVHQSTVIGVELEDGTILKAKTIISSCGYVETMRLCSHENALCHAEKVGQLSFVETISILNLAPKSLGLEDTIVFFNIGKKVHYQKPTNLVDLNSGVICIPNNYNYPNKTLEEGCVRITALANYEKWKALSQEEYTLQKKNYFGLLQNQMFYLYNNPTLQQKMESCTVAQDMFTPRTVEKYTSHLNGAIYGSTHKAKDGTTPLKNLFICGTDQGFLGIIGAMMSGVLIANKNLNKI